MSIGSTPRSLVLSCAALLVVGMAIVFTGRG